MEEFCFKWRFHELRSWVAFTCLGALSFVSAWVARLGRVGGNSSMTYGLFGLDAVFDKIEAVG